MLSSVPASRLLEGVAASLRTHVEPQVSDRFARMQLRAIDELLRNLAGRVEWSVADVSRETTEIEDLLTRLEQHGWDDERGGESPAREGASDDSVTSPQEALKQRAEALAALRRALNWAQEMRSPERDAARTAAAEFLRTENDRERSQLKSGMYS
jgi:hypothetical protein